VQPKAAGSSLIYKLCNKLALDAIHTCGITRVKQALVVPMATGMTMALFYLYLRQKRPNARFVVWTRIDQKTCLKAIQTAGYEPVVVENKLDGDQIVTDLDAVKAAIESHGAESSFLRFLFVAAWFN
jgi:O-phospho-L-seryl-tRNASec:L-selenocysteinyl-tRNA synthase